MYNSNFHGSDYYASLYYGVLRGDAADVTAFERLSLYDVQYEALILVVTGSDSRTMEREYWKGVFGGNDRQSTGDIIYEGMILGAGYSSPKDYYDAQTGVVWPDRNSSEKAYWLKVISDNI